MKISDLKFGDKFTIGNDSFQYVFICCYDKTYRYIDSTERIHRSYTNIEVEPVGSVEQDKKLVWINSSERAPTISDCDNTNCLYILYNGLVIRATITRLDEYFANEPFLWAPINKAPALPEPVYKLRSAEFPKDYNKKVYDRGKKLLGTLVGYNVLKQNEPYIVNTSSLTTIYYSSVYTLEKP